MCEFTNQISFSLSQPRTTKIRNSSSFFCEDVPIDQPQHGFLFAPKVPPDEHLHLLCHEVPHIPHVDFPNIYVVVQAFAVVLHVAYRIRLDTPIVKTLQLQLIPLADILQLIEGHLNLY